MTEILEKSIHKSLSKAKRNHKGPEGQYGFYIKLNSRFGIKFVSYADTKEDAMQGVLYEKAKEEVELLREVSDRCDFVPKCYGLVVVEFDGSWRCGIVMQHLGEKTAWHVYKSSRLEYKVNNLVYKIKNKLSMVGVINHDVHGANLMRYKRKWWSIDYTPNFIELKKYIPDTSWLIPCSY
jgi:hypothetical protein